MNNCNPSWKMGQDWWLYFDEPYTLVRVSDISTVEPEERVSDTGFDNGTCITMSSGRKLWVHCDFQSVFDELYGLRNEG